MTEWLTKQEVAAYLRVSLRQVHRLKLKHSLVGRLPRYAKEDVDDYLERNAVTPQPKLNEKGRPRRRAALTGRNFAAELEEYRRGPTRRPR